MPTDSQASGYVSGVPRLLLRLEGAALFAAALFFYAREGGAWELFAVLFLLPDLSLLAYFVGPKWGAIAYNTAHTTIGPLAYGALGAAFAVPFLLKLAAIHMAHVGFDRALGFGLKYGAAFSSTHLGRIGREPS